MTSLRCNPCPPAGVSTRNVRAWFGDLLSKTIRASIVKITIGPTRYRSRNLAKPGLGQIAKRLLESSGIVSLRNLKSTFLVPGGGLEPHDR